MYPAETSLTAAAAAAAKKTNPTHSQRRRWRDRGAAKCLRAPQSRGGPRRVFPAINRRSVMVEVVSGVLPTLLGSVRVFGGPTQ